MTLPLDGCHRARGAIMTPYAGYDMPLHYGDILREHKAVREACGLFDCSHMGEFLLSGPRAVQTLDRLLSNSFANLKAGRARYAVICNEQGGAVDDVIVYALASGAYLVVVNAANRQKDWDWFTAHTQDTDTVWEDLSEAYALLALQGPKAESVLRAVGAERLPERYFALSEGVTAAGVALTIARTGYTGEDGFELFCAPKDAAKLWDTLLETGETEGLLPCGLGARDTLRLEASLPLYGHELREDITPLEAGLAFAVKTDKPDFIGKDALLTPPKRHLHALRAVGRGIMREGCEVRLDGRTIGFCSSGTFCPTLNGAAALALLDGDVLPPGTAVTVDVRGRAVSAEVTALPLYKRS